MKVIREFAQPACMKMDAYRYTRLYKSMRSWVIISYDIKSDVKSMHPFTHFEQIYINT